eukprot:PhM_4_TR1650/c0_g1_i1/m.97129/K19759/DNAAF5; dynein assembly factor 5, axonemal
MSTLQHDLNLLLEQDRLKRKQALERINQQAQCGSIPAEDRAAVLKSVLKCFEDKVERCRETAVAVVTALVTSMDVDALDWVLPVVVARVGHDPSASTVANTPATAMVFVEESEELRLQLLTLALDILKAFPHDIGVRGFIEYYAAVLACGVKDPYPDVKKLACRGIVSLCAAEPNKVKPTTLPLAKIVKNHAMLHKHSAVRTEALKAFMKLLKHGAIEILGDMKDEAENRTTMHYLYLTCTDHTEGVRLVTLDLAAMCLLDLRERLEQHKRFLPLLLLSCADPLSVSVRRRAHEILDGVGQLYLMDNEDNRADLSKRRITAKDIEMYADDDDLYPLAEIRRLLKDDEVTRPSLGTRMATSDAMRNFIESFILTSLVSGVDPVKCKFGVRCLVMTALYSELYILEFLQMIVDAMYKVLADLRENTPEFEEIIPNIRIVCNIIGIFIPVEHYITILLPTNFGTLPVRHHLSVFMVMQELLKGSGAGKYRVNIEHAKNITRMVAGDAIVSSAATSATAPAAVAYVRLVVSVIDVFHQQNGILADPDGGRPMPDEVAKNPNITTLDFALLWALLCVLESPHAPVRSEVKAAIQKLSKIVSGTSDGIFQLHTLRCFSLKGGATLQLPSFIVAELQSHLQPVSSADVLEPFVTMYLHALSEVKFTVNVTEQLQYFTQLQELLAPEAGIIQHLPADAIRNILRVVVLPQCRFQPGGSAMLFRRVAASCLSNIAVSGSINRLAEADDVMLLEKIVDAWTGCLQSDEGEMRLTSVAAISHMWRLRALWSRAASSTHGQTVIKDIFDRLDDGNDIIRRRTLENLATCLENVASEAAPAMWESATVLTRHCVSPDVAKWHIRTLLLHMDDPSLEIRERALAVLKVVKKYAADDVVAQATEVRSRHTFVAIIDELMQA